MPFLNTCTLYLQFVFFFHLPTFFSWFTTFLHLHYRCVRLLFFECVHIRARKKLNSEKNTSKNHLYFIALYQIFSLQIHLLFFFFWQTLKKWRLQTEGTYDLIKVSKFLKEEAQRVKRRAIHLIILYLFVWILQMVFIFLIDVML